MKKALLICSVPCPEVEKSLMNVGYEFVKISDRPNALERVEIMTFDAAVLVSTGSDMDPLETMLNIKDLAKSHADFHHSAERRTRRRTGKTVHVRRVVLCFRAPVSP